MMKQRVVVKALVEKGFAKSNRKKHVYYQYCTIWGESTDVKTFFSRGSKSKEIDIGLVKEIAIQCNLSLKEFRLLIDCTLSRTQYEELLIQRKIIPARR